MEFQTHTQNQQQYLQSELEVYDTSNLFYLKYRPGVNVTKIQMKILVLIHLNM